MKKYPNETYALVDEEFMSKFSTEHKAFMESVYYEMYSKFIDNRYNNVRKLDKRSFFTNMHRRRIHIFQLCCPYCRNISNMFYDVRIQGKVSKAQLNYCPYCGRGSIVENMIQQLHRLTRIINVHRLGLKALKERYTETDAWLLGYDCYQIEIIEMASIIEVLLREYFEALLYINNFGFNNKYISKVIDRYTGNDFMNIDKANVHFKKAFDINLKSKLSESIWNDLMDIVSLRNMIIHNNGRVDEHFKTTQSYNRLNNHINGDLFKLEESDISKYINSLTEAIIVISNAFLEHYYKNRNNVVANYYFNNQLTMFDENDDT